jgi:hypothetical protein
LALLSVDLDATANYLSRGKRALVYRRSRRRVLVVLRELVANLVPAHGMRSVRVASTSRESTHFATISFSRAISPEGRNADPVSARQFEQWQLYAATNSSDTSYNTALHAQRPLSTPEL